MHCGVRQQKPGLQGESWVLAPGRPTWHQGRRLDDRVRAGCRWPGQRPSTHAGVAHCAGLAPLQGRAPGRGRTVAAASFSNSRAWQIHQCAIGENFRAQAGSNRAAPRDQPTTPARSRSTSSPSGESLNRSTLEFPTGRCALTMQFLALSPHDLSAGGISRAGEASHNR